MFYDTFGGEDYPRLRHLTYQYTNVFVLCFTLERNMGDWAYMRCEPDSLTAYFEENLNGVSAKQNRNFVSELKRTCPNTPFILVGCKADKRRNLLCFSEEERKRSEEFNAKTKEKIRDQIEKKRRDSSKGDMDELYTYEEGLRYAKEFGADAYIETSCVTGMNVELLKTEIFKSFLKNERIKREKTNVGCVLG